MYFYLLRIAFFKFKNFSKTFNFIVPHYQSLKKRKGKKGNKKIR